jgi:hypothetical protein
MEDKMSAMSQAHQVEVDALRQEISDLRSQLLARSAVSQAASQP